MKRYVRSTTSIDFDKYDILVQVPDEIEFDGDEKLLRSVIDADTTGLLSRYVSVMACSDHIVLDADGYLHGEGYYNYVCAYIDLNRDIVTRSNPDIDAELAFSDNPVSKDELVGKVHVTKVADKLVRQLTKKLLNKARVYLFK